MLKKVHVFRAKPGQELLGEIARYCRDYSITSAIIIGIIGSVALKDDRPIIHIHILEGSPALSYRRVLCLVR